MKSTHSLFLISAVIYLSIYHLRSQNMHLILDGEMRTDLMEVASDAPFQVGRDFSQVRSEISSTGSAGSSRSAATAIPDNALLQNALLQLQTYHPDHDPVLPDYAYKPSTSRPVQVHFLTGSTLSISAQSKFLIEGVERSQYLKLVHISFIEPHNIVKVLEINDGDPDVPMIWMVDLLGLSHDCHALEALVLHAIAFDKKQKQRPLLLLIDYSASSEQTPCTIQDLVGKEYLRIAQRGIIRNRQWNPGMKWVQPGDIDPNPGKQLSAGNILYSPFPVREAVVTEVNNFVEKQRDQRGLEKLRPVDANRSTDVIFFWRKGDNALYANLRREVANTVSSLQSTMTGNRKLRTLVRFFGDLELMDSTAVSGRYIEEMMGTKVIIVAQRDEWEDHYRFMESLATGALVLTDAMVGLPKGLVHGKNILVYDSTESLREQLLYYLDPQNDKERLSVAKKGWELVMGHHRCWHRVEELVFGTAQTAVDAVYGDAVYGVSPPPRRERIKSGKRIKKDTLELIEIPVDNNDSFSSLDSKDTP